MPECDTCVFLYIDDDGEESCEVELDEDEYARYLASHPARCPYYQGGGNDDDYRIVRHQN
ncbi:MAG: hypothetical protein IKQ97_02320 [Eubacterium sp.]|nr:hypothetical protein [Eubacterium sp.]